jgi:hypothetical protein
VQGRQPALDVLAGAEPIHPVIDTAARIGKTLEVADLHLVGPTGFRAALEGSENRMVHLNRLDGNDLGGAAPAAQRDLLVVGGFPPLQSGPIEHRAGASALLGHGPHRRFAWPRPAVGFRAQFLCHGIDANKIKQRVNASIPPRR